MSARARAWLPLVLLAVAVAAAALLAGPGSDGLPLDPRSPGPDGTKALVDTLGELGAGVRVAEAAGTDADVVLLLTDTLDEDGRVALEDWVAAGGRLVVADSSSPLTPEPVGSAAVAGFVGAPIPLDCQVAALQAVAEVQPGGPSVVYHAPLHATGCFARGEGHWLVASGLGDGVVVALGGPEVFTNAQLGSADHGLLAAALLAPEPGTRVTFLRPPRPGDGDASLADLLGPGVGGALVQVLVAFVLLAAWRARRLGRPLEEPQPVQIPGSELVVAVGNLLQQTRASRRAAALLRADTHRFVAERLGLPATVPAEQLADAAARRAGADEGEVRDVLAGPLPADDDGLVALARSAERVQSTVAGAGGSGKDAWQ